MGDFQRKVFRRAASTGQRTPMPKGEPGPFPGHPSVQMDDAKFIAQTMTRSKWADVEYYGPGAAAAEERRRQALGLGPAPAVPEGYRTWEEWINATLAANTVTPEVREGWWRRQLKRLGRGK